MVEKKKILVQLDSDPLPSVFDRVVAVDGGAEELFSYGGVSPEQVRDLVYGAMFTRGPEDLKSTAIFVGGMDVRLGEEIFAEAKKTFFGPLRVSLMLDSSGANTTAAAAVVAAARHLDLPSTSALILGSTGSVGRRVALLLARQGARVRVASRQQSRSAQVAADVSAVVEGASLDAVATGDALELAAALDGIELVVASGGAGAELLPLAARQKAIGLKLAIDLNAVPPVGIEGVDPMDAAKERDGVLAYGAIGVGGTKMKIHKAAIARLFTANDLTLDAEEIFAIGQEL